MRDIQPISNVKYALKDGVYIDSRTGYERLEKLSKQLRMSSDRFKI